MIKRSSPVNDDKRITITIIVIKKVNDNNNNYDKEDHQAACGGASQLTNLDDRGKPGHFKLIKIKSS